MKGLVFAAVTVAWLIGCGGSQDDQEASDVKMASPLMVVRLPAQSSNDAGQ